jgi:hypothetical protein
MARVWLELPDVPVTVTAAGPTVATALADRVSAVVVAVLAGQKEAVTPAGSSDAVNATVLAKAPIGVTEIVESEQLWPCPTQNAESDAVRK